MPAAGKFASGFGIHKGLKIGAWTLSSFSISHVEVVRFKTYRYPIRLTFTGSGTSTNILSSVKRKFAGKKTILSGYGNPYTCKIGNIKISSSSNGKIVITATGTGEKQYKHAGRYKIENEEKQYKSAVYNNAVYNNAVYKNAGCVPPTECPLEFIPTLTDDQATHYAVYYSNSSIANNQFRYEVLNTTNINYVNTKTVKPTSGMDGASTTHYLRIQVKDATSPATVAYAKFESNKLLCQSKVTIPPSTVLWTIKCVCYDSIYSRYETCIDFEGNVIFQFEDDIPMKMGNIVGPTWNEVLIPNMLNLLDNNFLSNQQPIQHNDFAMKEILLNVPGKELVLFQQSATNLLHLNLPEARTLNAYMLALSCVAFDKSIESLK